MDACLSVEREQDRLAKKYNSIKEHTESSLAELINQISSIQEELSKGKMKAFFLCIFSPTPQFLANIENSKSENLAFHLVLLQLFFRLQVVKPLKFHQFQHFRF